MSSSVLGITGLIIFFLAYRFYGTYLSRKIFNLSSMDRDNIPTPAYELEDGVDYLPAKKQILIGHHFSSIAGAAPIVGPAVAAIWGWVPAFLWVTFGVVFMGACHDFGALVLSMKYKGQSIGGIGEKVLGKEAKVLFLTVIFFLVWMVIAVFALVIANLFIKFPGSVIPVNFEIIIAILMGVFIGKKNKGLLIPSLLAQGCLLIMIYLGTKNPITFEFLGEFKLMGIVIFLLIYSFIASILPVNILLQPRDYINSHQLFLGLGLLILGLIITNPPIVAPAVNPNPVGAPPMFPYLFITIACGAISGFHGLVSSGTTSKQIQKWRDAKPVAFGSMLGEGLLALLATLAVTAGFGSTEKWHNHYASWDQANGLSNKISAFVMGSSHFIEGVGIPAEIGQTIMAVLIISFAATSLDTACRIQRYILTELGEVANVPQLKNRYLSSAIAIISAFLLMISADGGKGGLAIWPLFGATNQMLAGLTLLTISVYLIQNRIKSMNFLIPAVIIIVVTSIGLFLNIQSFYNQKSYFLLILGIVLLGVQFWTVFLGFKMAKNKKSCQ